MAPVTQRNVHFGNPILGVSWSTPGPYYQELHPTSAQPLPQTLATDSRRNVRRAAGTLGTEAALFVPTATMANLIAVMCHCQQRGTQLFLGQNAHLHLYEHGGAAQVAGVHSQALPDLPDGTFDLDQLELTIREAHGSRYHPRPQLICLENTHSSAGGRVLPLTYLRQVRELADHYGLQVHMDGARLMNAAVAQGVEPAQIAQHCDSVSLCFSKALC
ncbi:probable low-specificity L-threonine aldolase 1 [Manacus vitellinus]|uniref:probable low-specificity L-threonine aldolase 1 n=1 Tax=Manacus vitellinus TaxID=328815 RepID=UPI00115D1FA7|nr:probable low-specificity L-threonine aldolase 1 [Manacus vitellinus]